MGRVRKPRLFQTVLDRIPGEDRFAFDAVLVWVAGINAAGHLIATQSARLLDAPAATAQLLYTAGCIVLLGATLLDNAQLFAQVRTLAISDSLINGLGKLQASGGYFAK